MTNIQNGKVLRDHLLEARKLIEPHANESAAVEHLGIIDQLLGPYIADVNSGKVKVSPADLRKIESHLNASRKAAKKGSVVELLESNRSMISALPDEPFTRSR